MVFSVLLEGPVAVREVAVPVSPRPAGAPTSASARTGKRRGAAGHLLAYSPSGRPPPA